MGILLLGQIYIGYRLLRYIWDFYSSILLESWSHGLITGELAPSHRESVICLLEKKGKDRRYIQNLRPISLSNCDIKIITKALTARFNQITNMIIHPMQSAYVPNRQVHDNLRLINIVKSHTMITAYNTVESNPVLISLDVQKAFDSVSH